jgi:hypothetical protein
MKRWALAVLALVSCDRGVESPELVIREEVRGDTVLVTSSGAVEIDVLESVDVLWQDQALGDPTSMVLVGEHLVIGDTDRVHVVPRIGGEVRSFGSAGEGPGEFGRVVGVGRFGRDTIATYDVRLRRLSLFSLEGEFLESHQIPPHETFANPSGRGFPVIRSGSGFLSIATGNLFVGRPIQLAVMWQSVETDSAEIIGTWDDRQMEEIGGNIVATRELYPPRAIVALGSDGQVAEGNGVDYCVRMWEAFHEGIRVACRERPPVPIGAGIRSPDFDVIAGDARKELIELAVGFQDVGDVLPHFDELMYVESGDLWIRILHEEMGRVHPSIVNRRPELGPERRRWDVFDADGRLKRAVDVPAAFDPFVVVDDQVYGFFTLVTGEVTIGVGALSEDVVEQATKG